MAEINLNNTGRSIRVPDINQPAAPGEGPAGLPTPALPDINQPAAPGEGPFGLPTPALPSRPQTPTPSVPSRPQTPTPSVPSRPQTPTPSVPSRPQIVVRQCPTGYTRKTVQANQTFTDLLLENNVSFDAMRSANPNLSTTRPASGAVYCAPPSGARRVCAYGSRSYTMGEGETLYTLVRTLNSSTAQLLRANPELAPGDFLPGRVICLP